MFQSIVGWLQGKVDWQGHCRGETGQGGRTQQRSEGGAASDNSSLLFVPYIQFRLPTFMVGSVPTQSGGTLNPTQRAMPNHLVD